MPIEVPPERKKIHFDFPACAKSGRTVLELKHARKAYGDLVVFNDLDLHIERGDRIALVGPNGAGKSTLMRMLSGEEAPDAGERVDGHNVVMQYFAQDEATRMDPAPTVYETLASGSPLQMVPMIRNILGGFLFSGDDVYKQVRVLSGGERTRLAVARMLLRPSNTLLLDEPTNHLDLDSKEVLLDALVDYGGTLIFVSHDRYFVERLATKIIEIGNGTRDRVSRAPTRSSSGTRSISGRQGAAGRRGRRRRPGQDADGQARPQRTGYEPPAPPDKPARPPRPKRCARPTRTAVTRREEARRRRGAQAARAASRRGAQRIDRSKRGSPRCEAAIREIEQHDGGPGFYDDRAAAQPVIDRHQALMWQVGDLMHQWEELQSARATSPAEA